MSISARPLRIESERHSNKETTCARFTCLTTFRWTATSPTTKGDMSWAHKRDEEWNAFTSGNASGEAELLFGRVTYEMMAAFWPTPEAARMLPQVAAGMNRMRKFVVSRTLKEASWQNTTLLKGDLVSEANRLKQQPGPDLLIMGSGSIVSQLTEAGLIDAYQIVMSRSFSAAAARCLKR